MTKEQFDSEIRYGAMMVIGRAMLSRGIVNEKDICKIDTILRRKYRPIIGSLQPSFIPKKP